MDKHFNLKNIIGIESLDANVYNTTVFDGYFDRLVIDPGEMVGWAGTADGDILVGQAPWFECIHDGWNANLIYLETTPYAARRTFDPWPMRFDGIVRAKMYPHAPLPVYPMNLNVSRKWFTVPRGSGIGKHARDALTHLVHVLVTDR